MNRFPLILSFYILHLLAGLSHLAAVLLQPDGVDGDEASGVLWPEVADLVHGALLHVVQLLGVGPAADDGEGALVDAAADGAVDGVLGCLDALQEEAGLWREVETVVENLQDESV